MSFIVFPRVSPFNAPLSTYYLKALCVYVCVKWLRGEESGDRAGTQTSLSVMSVWESDTACPVSFCCFECLL